MNWRVVFVFRSLLLAVFAAGFLVEPVSASPSNPWSAERHLILAASHRLQHTSPTSVQLWLRRQTPVSSTAIGRDGRTLVVRFRDGVQAAVLPAGKPSAAPVPMFSNQARVRTGAAAGRPRALVLEPFATSLNLGPNAGSVEAADLQGAGYQVDLLRDSAVTIDTMETLANYNVVYIVTHSGVNQWGEGVVSTGQVADNDPAIDPMIKEFSVMVVTVAGDNQLYYGVMSRFIQYHVGQFPAYSMMFINGCSMLGASLFWQALQSKGVSAMISWDHDALAGDDVQTADDFFGAMYSGKDIADAVAAVRADGLGISRPADQPVANFGYLGDGTLTLATAADRTPVVQKPHLNLLKHVQPGQPQQFSISSAPGDSLQLTVTYPNGTRRSAVRVTNSAGTLTYRYTQPASVITPSSTVARVVVKDLKSGSSTSSSYAIGLGSFDLHIAPSPGKVGRHVTFSVYSHRNGRGQVDITRSGRVWRRMPVRLQAGRWIHLSYLLPPSLAHTHLRVRANLFGIGTITQPLSVT